MSLNLCDWQHTIKHAKTSDFVLGEKVFLKSNPECEMIVYSVNKNTITTFWRSKYKEVQTCEFPPECILQYKYSGLKTYKKTFHVSLN